MSEKLYTEKQIENLMIAWQESGKTLKELIANLLPVQPSAVVSAQRINEVYNEAYDECADAANEYQASGKGPWMGIAPHQAGIVAIYALQLPNRGTEDIAWEGSGYIKAAIEYTKSIRGALIELRERAPKKEREWYQSFVKCGDDAVEWLEKSLQLPQPVTPVQPSAVVSAEELEQHLHDWWNTNPIPSEDIGYESRYWGPVARFVCSLQLPQPVAPCPDCEGDTEFGLCETCGSRGNSQPVDPVQSGGVEEALADLLKDVTMTEYGFEIKTEWMVQKITEVVSHLTTTQNAPSVPDTTDGQTRYLLTKDQLQTWTWDEIKSQLTPYSAPSVGSVPNVPGVDFGYFIHTLKNYLECESSEIGKALLFNTKIIHDHLATTQRAREVKS